MEKSHFAELVLFTKKLAEQDLKTAQDLSYFSQTDAEKGFYAGMAQASSSEVNRIERLYEVCLANEKNAGQGVLG
ncbi:hypothetical protein NOM01_11165 [Sporolactobacillus sp. STSJ-5]|uniref:hypothetical protein n=1 Tax=Sporolactobacillus sp. STSJ-5 TaxID=2965076 RepID=UPI0021075C6F|nr:hypothetical protein [Sporolactobacillus sp. STSJ-5]MCQ2010576.1 hypothetical protein [Sporolactobacillus sp. STSJ-5]